MWDPSLAPTQTAPPAHTTPGHMATTRDHHTGQASLGTITLVRRHAASCQASHSYWPRHWHQPEKVTIGGDPMVAKVSVWFILSVCCVHPEVSVQEPRLQSVE